MLSPIVLICTLLSLILLSNAVPVELEKRAELLSCSTYKPQGSSPSSFKIRFYDNNPTDQPSSGPGNHSPYLPANTSSKSQDWKLATSSSGASFKVKSCSSKSLQPSTSQSCSHGGCYKAYTSYAQIIRSDGLCLSQENPGSVSTNLVWKTCYKNRHNSQLFELDQYVNYAPGYASITSYGKVSFNLIQKSVDTGPFNAFDLDTDRKTLKVIQFDYTQKGLSGTLISA